MYNSLILDTSYIFTMVAKQCLGVVHDFVTHWYGDLLNMLLILNEEFIHMCVLI